MTVIQGPCVAPARGLSSDPHPYPPAQVTMDSQGLMKVTHMLSLGGAGADARGGHYASEADFQNSQRLAAQRRVGVAQFLILSEQAADGEEDDL